MIELIGYLGTPSSAISDRVSDEISSTLTQGRAYLISEKSDGILLARYHPCVSNRSLPNLARDPQTGIFVAAVARLDANVERTARTRGAETNEASILQAYLRGGEAWVQQLEGDWAFALWDPRSRELLLARSPTGVSSLCYTHLQGGIAFATRPHTLLQFPGVNCTPNLLRVAQVLTSWAGDGSQTAFEGIRRLPAGHILTIRAEGSSDVLPQRFWFPERVGPLRLGSDAAYEEAFLEQFQQAVDVRLTGEASLAATLSAGLDSGAVCALAGATLKTRGERLHAYTSVPLYPASGAITPYSLSDEAPLAESTAKWVGNVEVEAVRAASISPLEGIRRSLNDDGEPLHAASNLFWLHAVLQTARQQERHVLLTGQSGNGTVSWAGRAESFWLLFATGQWQRISHYVRTADLTPWAIIKAHLLRPVALPVRRYQARWQLGDTPWTSYSAIHPDFARSLSLYDQMRAAGHDPSYQGSASPKHEHLRLIRTTNTTIGPVWTDLNARYGVEMRDPTADQRLVEFVLSLPNEQFYRGGHERWLIRRAMKGLLPDEVRLNHRRGHQAADLAYRLRATLPEVRDVMDTLQRSELARTVLDLPRMNQVVASLEHEITPETTTNCITILTRGMMAGLFLARF